MEDQYGSDFITIVDDDGAEYELEVLSTLEWNGCSYLAVIPAANSAEEFELEVSILKSVEEDGESILTIIEDEAFYGASSISKAVLPGDIVEIGSKAFADSSLSKVYIPSTVLTIAEDAFDGTDITIVTPDGTYAKEYADAHGLQWEDGSDHYGRDTLSGALDMLEARLITIEPQK